MKHLILEMLRREKNLQDFFHELQMMNLWEAEKEGPGS